MNTPTFKSTLLTLGLAAGISGCIDNDVKRDPREVFDMNVADAANQIVDAADNAAPDLGVSDVSTQDVFLSDAQIPDASLYHEAPFTRGQMLVLFGSCFEPPLNGNCEEAMMPNCCATEADEGTVEEQTMAEQMCVDGWITPHGIYAPVDGGADSWRLNSVMPSAVFASVAVNILQIDRTPFERSDDPTWYTSSYRALDAYGLVPEDEDPAAEPSQDFKDRVISYCQEN